PRPCEAHAPATTDGTLQGVRMSKRKKPPVNRQPSPAALPRPKLKGGTLQPNEALSLLNHHFLVGTESGVEALYRIGEDDKLRCISNTEFTLSAGDILVDTVDQHGKPKFVPGPKWWLTNKDRNRQ